MAIQVGIHREPDHEFRETLGRYEEILRHNQIQTVRLSVDDPDFWEKVRALSLFIYCWQHDDRSRHAAAAVLPIVERQLKVATYPNWHTAWHFDDKIRQWYLLHTIGFPMAKSWVFWGREQALAWADSAELPVIFKLARGAGSSNVVKIDRQRDIIKLINRMFGRGVSVKGLSRSLAANFKRQIFRWGAIRKRRWKGQDVPYTMRGRNWEIHKGYVFFQEYLPDNDYDTRITVIGGRAFGFRRFNRPGDFRASGSGLINYELDGIDPECLRIAFKISKQLGFQSMAYDFLKAPDGSWQIGEISFQYLDTAIRRCTGYWDENLQWTEGQFWPQYCHLVDALGLPDLEQPQLSPDA